MLFPVAASRGYPKLGASMKRGDVAKTATRPHSAVQAQSVVSLQGYRNTDMLKSAEALVEAIKAGHVRGAVLGIRYRSGDPPYDVVAIGEYADDDIAALGMASTAWGQIRDRQKTPR
jgi:hypothetical protein